MKRFAICLAVVLGIVYATPAFAQANSCTGPHYNLNIIGVPKGKNPPMDDSNRHTLFVPLDRSGDAAAVKISYIAGDEFQVLDGNCTDADGCLIEVPHEPLGDLCYEVWATGLGKPFNGQAVVEAQCIIEDLVGSCTDALLLDSFTVGREKGKPKPVPISDVFRATGCIDLDPLVNPGCTSGDLLFTNVWIFNIPQLLDYFWDYDANGLKLMQVRFCGPTTCGSFTTVP